VTPTRFVTTEPPAGASIAYTLITVLVTVHVEAGVGVGVGAVVLAGVGVADGARIG
jgi:hypothetical protein